MTIAKHYTYIVQCSDGSLYTGYTTDISKRIATHNAGKGAKYTRSRLPVKLIAFREFETKSEAMRMEAQVKKVHRRKKVNLLS